MPLAETNNQVTTSLNPVMLLTYSLGLILFVIWLIKTSFGKKSLDDAEPRNNNIPVYMPFALLVFWFFLISALTLIAQNIFPDKSDWQKAFAENLVLSLGTIAASILVINLARRFFVNKLKGLGLDLKTIHKDIASAALNLAAIWPIIMFTFITTILIGQLIFGDSFQIKQHEELKLITTYPQIQLRVLIFLTATVVVPIFEELLFRGMFQTTIRSYISTLPVFDKIQSKSLKTWAGIAVTSVLFAIAHQQPAHWPALFVLSLALGYSYEKSNSLFRPIFIHIFFNGIAVLSTLYAS